jgi:hypothetical protein
VVCLSKIVRGPRWARPHLGAFSAAAWLIVGLATLESSLENVGVQPKAANSCFCELSLTVVHEYARGKSGECGRADREIRQIELQSGVLSYSQRRSRA